MKFLKRVGKISLFVIWIILTINIVSIIHEYNRDKKAIVIPLNEHEEIFQTDVSDMSDDEVFNLMISDLLEGETHEEESSEE